MVKTTLITVYRYMDLTIFKPVLQRDSVTCQKQLIAPQLKFKNIQLSNQQMLQQLLWKEMRPQSNIVLLWSRGFSVHYLAFHRLQNSSVERLVGIFLGGKILRLVSCTVARDDDMIKIRLSTLWINKLTTTLRSSSLLFKILPLVKS